MPPCWRTAFLSLAVLFALSSSLPLVSAYQVGDPVPMMQRSSYKGYVSGWIEVLYSDCPRFGESRSVRWQPMSEQTQTFDPTQPYKMYLTRSPHTAPRLVEVHRALTLPSLLCSLRPVAPSPSPTTRTSLRG